MTPFPESTHLSRSWVIYHADGTAIGETFERRNALKAHSMGYPVKLIGDHLGSVQKAIDNAP